MKKQYIKPMIQASNLSIDTGVSAACSVSANYQEFSCPVVVPDWGMTIFSDSSCDLTGPGMDDQICYHVPFANNSIFTS